ncbi:MAG: extracellular solute-binding protein [Bacteroidetes bacterium]|jgi:iron(III) transport system substrate-binding protein|nr:extracellular solute-binding protein [Bacteroidota bacterium]
MMRTVVVLLVALVLFSCASDDRETLVVYSPHGKELLEASEEAFEAKYPDVDVQWIDMGGQDAYDRIRTESANPQASLWWGGASTAFDRAAREGLLEPYVPTWSDAAADNAFDPDGFWYGTFLTPEVIAYNSRTLDITEAPQDWDALIEPEWRDRILIRYPLASSTMRTIFGAMILRQPTVEDGYAWLARLDVNTKAYTANPTQLYLRLAREEADVSLWNMPDIYLQAEMHDYPFDYLIPTSGTPVLADGIALVEGGPNLDRARQFYEHVTTDSALVRQAHEYYRIPVRQDIASERLPGWMTRAAITPMPIDWGRLEQEGATWMQYWDENIKGRGAEWLAERGLD